MCASVNDLTVAYHICKCQYEWFHIYCFLFFFLCHYRMCCDFTVVHAGNTSNVLLTQCLMTQTYDMVCAPIEGVVCAPIEGID